MRPFRNTLGQRANRLRPIRHRPATGAARIQTGTDQSLDAKRSPIYQLLSVLYAQGRRTGAALRSVAHELARLLCDNDGLEFPQELLGLMQRQTKSRRRRQIGASLDHADGHRWRPRVIAVFDPDFNDGAPVGLLRCTWAFIVPPPGGGGCPRNWPLPSREPSSANTGTPSFLPVPRISVAARRPAV